jgi:hypothetical protein
MRQKMSFTPDQLHVISVISNPQRFQTRYKLYKDFEKEMLEAGVHLVTVETAFGERKHGVTLLDSPNHVLLRTSTELWHKENMINLGVQVLPDDWEYVAWIDADISFLRKDWAVETIHQLQHHSIVQLFQNALDLGPLGETFNVYNGFGYSFANGLPEWTTSNHPYAGKGGKYWHPGFAWAARREAWDDLGGLIDHAILGAADHHMALSLIGKAQQSIPEGIHKNYIDLVLRWQRRADLHIRQNIGYVPGTIAHHWHGKKKDRKYWDRWEILKRWNFDPFIDIKRDYQGLWQLSHEGIRMRNDLRSYFRQRNEDSIDFD